MGMVIFNRKEYVCRCVEFYGDIMLLDGWCKPMYRRVQNYVLDVSDATFKTSVLGDLGSEDNGVGFTEIILTGEFDHITVRTGGVMMKYLLECSKGLELAG